MRAAVAGHAVEVAEQREQLAGIEVVEERGVLQLHADPPLDAARDRARPARRGSRRCPRRAASVPRSSRASSSCRRRSARGSRTSRPRSTARSMPRHGLEVAVASWPGRARGSRPRPDPSSGSRGRSSRACRWSGPAPTKGRARSAVSPLRRDIPASDGTSRRRAYVASVACSSSPRIASPCPRRSAGASPAARRGARARARARGAGRARATAVEELFRRHWPSAHRAAFLIVQDAAAAEDIAQEAFVAALRALDRFDRRRPFAPWLHRIVANRAIDWSRARTARREVYADDADSRGRADADPPSRGRARRARRPRARAARRRRPAAPARLHAGAGREPARAAARNGQLAPSPRARPARRRARRAAVSDRRRHACARARRDRRARTPRPPSSVHGRSRSTRSRRASRRSRVAGGRRCG